MDGDRGRERREGKGRKKGEKEREKKEGEVLVGGKEPLHPLDFT